MDIRGGWGKAERREEGHLYGRTEVHGTRWPVIQSSDSWEMPLQEGDGDVDKSRHSKWHTFSYSYV